MVGELKATLLGDAVISGDSSYRYLLTRVLDPGLPICTFIMLNPSTADAKVDDPTIRRCIGYARAWSCGTLHVVNLFAVRATDPAMLRVLPDPVGQDNHTWIDWAVSRARPDGEVVCAWGTKGTYMDQDKTVLGWLDSWSCKPKAIGKPTKDGHPRHPLYAKADWPLLPFTGRA